MLQITISKDNGMHHKTLGSLFTYMYTGVCKVPGVWSEVVVQKQVLPSSCRRLQVTKIYCWIAQNNQFISLITESSDLTKLKKQKWGQHALRFCSVIYLFALLQISLKT